MPLHSGYNLASRDELQVPQVIIRLSLHSRTQVKIYWHPLDSWHWGLTRLGFDPVSNCKGSWRKDICYFSERQIAYLVTHVEKCNTFLIKGSHVWKGTIPYQKIQVLLCYFAICIWFFIIQALAHCVFLNFL